MVLSPQHFCLFLFAAPLAIFKLLIFLVQPLFNELIKVDGI
jgi:hypothetical protein